ncbi:hypothetical protein [Aliarcobacter butzleri]|uniref:hypothetical protein n=1 Tax=Aliarcobacter butzleri TaxID=28197 RepID=UPI0021B20BC9|nr:hypothetical protein [Aliarcobacter butzleri]MCT7596564.1 hypothetical protein [Aliarcobacter butzleri]MDN5095184.1 hypothetical protein [Aliarcobacter butzleri]
MENFNQQLFDIMINTLIHKYGLFINTKDCAKILGISGRTLDERRKSGMDCPEYLEEKKCIMYPVQKIVEYQINKTKNSIKTL